VEICDSSSANVLAVKRREHCCKFVDFEKGGSLGCSTPSRDSSCKIPSEDTLLKVWDQTHKTVLMVTHDVDEALYLSDRLLLMTDGPGGRVGRVISLPFARSRERASVLEHHQYHPLRESIFNFLEDHAAQSSLGRVSGDVRNAAGRELLA
jgi:hypothetical protein